jgi:hypothetical protein
LDRKAGLRTDPNMANLIIIIIKIYCHINFSFDTFWRKAPISSVSSVGKGPSPTLVVYAFTTP